MHKISLVLLAICLQASDIRISEVMSNPQGSEYENEFVEIYNTTAHVMHINGWILSDGNGEDSLVHLSGPDLIQPNGFALILDPGYPLATGPYLNLIPDSIPLYTISTDASFGSGGLSNSGESVIIRNSDASVMTQMAWTSSTNNGFSWERVSTDTPDSSAQWQESLVENGTPGFRNSISRPQLNLSLNELTIVQVELGEPVRIDFVIQNTGEDEISSFSIAIHLDRDQNGVEEDTELVFFQEYTDRINSGALLQYPVVISGLGSGLHRMSATLFVQGDENSTDDSLHFEVAAPYPRHAVAITEIMYSPTSEQEGEWIEIRNLGETPISLQGWSLSDANQTQHRISDSLYILEPDYLLCLCADKKMAEYFTIPEHMVMELNSWPTLNSTSDSIRLFDATGHAVASVYYRGSWGSSGISLERRHPNLFPTEKVNWSPSTHADGGTPSHFNTRQLVPVALEIESIDLWTFEDIGPSQATIKIRFRNMGLDTLRWFEVASDADTFWQGILTSFMADSLVFTSPMLWPGYSSVPIRIIQNELLLADTSVQAVLGYQPGLLAINEIHYLPDEDQVEFLEFKNIGAEALNLLGWSFEDRSGAEGRVLVSIDIQSDTYFLLCGDSMSLSDWTDPGTQMAELSVWPSLNNSSDSIFIKDPLGNIQLSHGYTSARGGESGKSLERTALWKSIEHQSSWATCVDESGITPGRDNSVLIPPNNIALGGFIMVDSLLWEQASSVAIIQVTNGGNGIVTDAKLNIQMFQNGGTVSDDEWMLSLLTPDDTLEWHQELFFKQSGWIDLHAQITSQGDEKSDDDTIYERFYVSSNSTPLIINEVMPVPEQDQMEWIEVLNRSNRHVDIRGWQISDNNLTLKPISNTSSIIAPKNFVLLGGAGASIGTTVDCPLIAMADFPTLNNGSDAVHLYDPQGLDMDEMSYDEYTALAEGRSLERIRPDIDGSVQRNWGICIDENAATPGRENSLVLTSLAQELQVNLTPNPFTPNGDGLDDQLEIQYELPVEQGLISVRIYDMAGRKIAEPVIARAVSHRGKLTWDGELSYGGVAGTGMYICMMLIDDLQGNVIKTLKKIYLVK